MFYRSLVNIRYRFTGAKQQLTPFGLVCSAKFIARSIAIAAHVILSAVVTIVKCYRNFHLFRLHCELSRH